MTLIEITRAHYHHFPTSTSPLISEHAKLKWCHKAHIYVPQCSIWLPGRINGTTRGELSKHKMSCEVLTMLGRRVEAYLGNVSNIVVTGMVLVVFGTRLTVGSGRVVLCFLALFSLVFSWSCGSVEILYITIVWLCLTTQKTISLQKMVNSWLVIFETAWLLKYSA